MTIVKPNKGESFAHLAGRRYKAFFDLKGKDHVHTQYYLSLNPHIKDTKDFKQFEQEFEEGKNYVEEKDLEETAE